MRKAKKPAASPAEDLYCPDIRTACDPKTLSRAIADNLCYVQARHTTNATPNDWYTALAYTIRDRLLHRWIQTLQAISAHETHFAAYLSAEFLTGPHLANNLLNLGIMEETRQALALLNQNLDDLIAQEEEPGLGNGGLGRLAACYMDSLATLQMPAIGYGIRYEFGIFDQIIRDGWQVEMSDKWLHLGNPWEIARPEIAYEIKLGGKTEAWIDPKNHYRVRWIPHRIIKGVAYDTPILGYRVNNVNLLRLWKAEAGESFDFQAFNHGDYQRAVEDKVASETISKVLYPNDDLLQGKQLRLAQQYFLVSCSLQDMMRLHHLRRGRKPQDFHQSVTVQLNDTHPVLAIPELMRILIDDYSLDWDTAWQTTTATFAYTNHTLLTEALEKWSLPLFAELLPRHLEIVFEINRRFLHEVRLQFPADEPRIARMSLIDEAGNKSVRMANLAAVGTSAINGVAQLHTDLLKSQVLRDFAEMYPEKFLNITNGVTPRRWLALCNPGLTKLISSRIGEEWITNTAQLRKLEPLAVDPDFQKQWRQVKLENKQRLAKLIHDRTSIAVTPDSLFDIQVKRLHEYKRQHLNVLHVITLYNLLRQKDPAVAHAPKRTVIFGGKAAPGYRTAKLIIKLINSVAEVINKDPAIGDRLKVVFIPDFNVTTGHYIYPAADLSQQISTAGKEASGTGNMKFAFNGALTIGTLDGANIEIRREVGEDNFFLFGLTAEQVQSTRASGYNPQDLIKANPLLAQALDQLATGLFSYGNRDLFKPLLEPLYTTDPYMLLADYASYIACQTRAAATYTDQPSWTRMSILNVARMGLFSSDRSIQQYAEKIWHLTPCPIPCSNP